ncbi:MAG: hypothetical protein CMO55_00085 [Verrucomicrobiales bacterium]|nr:hypothetical protein [Verrucomicrobiales bacterium]
MCRFLTKFLNRGDVPFVGVCGILFVKFRIPMFKLFSTCAGLAALVAGISCFPTNTSAQESPGKTIIILDASGSMWGQIDGQPKIEIARNVIGELLNDLDPNIELGLMAYGHREKGNCDDIELLVPPGKVDRGVFQEKVMSIIPKGKTPLTDAVEQASNYLQIEENAANVILVSDGLETCDRDPCVLAAELASKGIAFRTHIVAFDLTAEESASFRCLADETGGTFLQAQDASTLKDALEIAVEASSVAKADMPAKPEVKLDPATLNAPESVPAGSVFEVTWEGPNNRGDYLTVVDKEADDGKYGNYAYTRNGSPSKLTAPVDPGLCEVRYMADGGKVLGRVDIQVTKTEGTLKAPSEAVAGSSVSVEWEGPNNKGDYITIVAKGADEGAYRAYAYTANGSPAKVRALPDAGEAEVRYVTGQGGKTLVSVPITITEADVVVSGPETIDAGDELTVDWKGPGNQGDYITIVKADAEEGKYNSYAYTKNSDDGKVTFTGVEEAGEDYEIRYVEGQEGKTLASAPIIVLPVSASVSGPESAVAGSEIEVEWIGPKFKGYYVTVVEKSAEIGKYERYFYTRNEESPAKVEIPQIAGEGEIRFMTAKGNVLASAPIQITEATAAFTKVPEKVAAGGKFRVEWEGPDNKQDFITIVLPDAEDGKYNDYIYTHNGPDQDLSAPDEPGIYEVRYVTSRKNFVLARKKVEVVAE